MHTHHPSHTHGATPTGQPFARHLLLWAMRAWVAGMRRRTLTAGHIQGALAVAGIDPAALGPLDRFMGALCLGATRQIRIDCVCIPTVSDDEKLLLDAIALYQDHPPGRPLPTGIALLQTLMDPDSALEAGAEASRLALMLTQAGHRLDAGPGQVAPPRTAATSKLEWLVPNAPTAPGARTVH